MKKDPSCIDAILPVTLYATCFSDQPYYGQALQIGYKACSAGLKEQEANNYLEKKVKANESMSPQETIEVHYYFLSFLL